jgi:2,4-dienoyl-CoA reductase-like NADH-dependent reductase (Old Yellow Enzyme family)
LSHSKLRLKNRLVMPPIETQKADEQGRVTDELLRYYDEKSRGGCLSLVIVEHSYVSPEGMARSRQLSVSNDGDVEGLRKLAARLRENGVACAQQITHAGSVFPGPDRAFGPSAVPHPVKGTTPVELTRERIHEIVRRFGEAAARVKEAGFDAVEIHGAHGFLLNQFHSPLTNKRGDEYGGALENRIRIHLEAIAAVRDAVGPDFPVLLRFGGCDYTEGGFGLDDCALAVRSFEKAGVDLLDISGGFCRFTHPTSKEPGYFSEISTLVKQNVSIPVILTGGVKTGPQAELLLSRSAADLIGVGRALIEDSDWARKAVESVAAATEGNK